MENTEKNLPSSSSKVHSKILSGFLYGLGFSVSFIGLVGFAIFLTWWFSERNSNTEETGKAKIITFGENSGVFLKFHEPKRSENNLKVLGVIGNKGEEVWESIYIQVNLFDERDRFVGLCTGISSGPLYPEKEKYFSVDCKGDKWDPIPSYNRYTIEIIDAHYKFWWKDT